ncbi:MAG: Asp-tRNA(Asn)/Glu-tRNA(Gln) amidotransferase subunit GatC [Gammaproteobacteria bacterium]|nr:Asp-tRNA(Asn)/Glu-tRNA(Gln) amidotransferase subunit GatC [Gammaproteobacteria bacterium]
MNNTITEELVRRVAHLARLGIQDKNIPIYVNGLANTVKLVAQLQRADTSGIDPTAHPLDVKQLLREDVVTAPNQREKLQAHSPATEAGLFLVPQVIE